MKCQSECFKKGEPEDHRLAVLFTKDFLESNKKYDYYEVIKDHEMFYPKKFIIEQLPSNRVHFSHEFDLVIRNTHTMKIIAVIEMNGNIGFYYRAENGRVKKARSTRHSHELQMRNDKVNMNFIERYHPGTKYITLFKEEVLGDCGRNGKDDRYITNRIRYLTEILSNYIIMVDKTT